MRLNLILTYLYICLLSNSQLNLFIELSNNFVWILSWKGVNFASVIWLPWWHGCQGDPQASHMCDINCHQSPMLSEVNHRGPTRHSLTLSVPYGLLFLEKNIEYAHIFLFYIIHGYWNSTGSWNMDYLDLAVCYLRKAFKFNHSLTHLQVVEILLHWNHGQGPLLLTWINLNPSMDT